MVVYCDSTRLVPRWFSLRRHGPSVYSRCTGVWSCIAIGFRNGRHHPWLRCCHVGLANPNMVTSCHIREYTKSKKRRKIVKALRSTLKWVVRVDTYILKCLLYLDIVMFILIVSYIDNMLLVTDIYLFSL